MGTLHVQNVTMSQFCEFTQRVCNTNMDGLYIFAHGRLNNVWTRLNDVVISISQAQIETEVHWNSCLSFAGRLEPDFFLSYDFWSVFVTCRTQLEALCKQARRFTASTGIATLACLKPRQLQYLLRERKTPEEEIAKSETRKLQESRRLEGMQKFFVSGCFKLFQSSATMHTMSNCQNRCMTVPGWTSWMLHFLHSNYRKCLKQLVPCLTFYIKFHAAWGYGGEGTRRETSHAEWPHRHCVK